MRKIIESILIGFCVILLTAVSSNSQQAKEGPAVNNETVTASKQAKAKTTPVIACTETNNLTNTEIIKILERHNTERASVKAPDIVWDCNLAKMAQEWATRGKAEHRPDNFLGENIFVSSDPKAKATQSVKQWVHEKKRLIPGTMNCKPGKICLHYTQVVAPISLKLGCGINRNATGKWKTLVVCNYDPNGNGY